MRSQATHGVANREKPGIGSYRQHGGKGNERQLNSVPTRTLPPKPVFLLDPLVESPVEVEKNSIPLLLPKSAGWGSAAAAKRTAVAAGKTASISTSGKVASGPLGILRNAALSSSSHSSSGPDSSTQGKGAVSPPEEPSKNVAASTLYRAPREEDPRFPSLAAAVSTARPEKALGKEASQQADAKSRKSRPGGSKLSDALEDIRFTSPAAPVQALPVRSRPATAPSDPATSASNADGPSTAPADDGLPLNDVLEPSGAQQNDLDKQPAAADALDRAEPLPRRTERPTSADAFPTRVDPLPCKSVPNTAASPDYFPTPSEKNSSPPGSTEVRSPSDFPKVPSAAKEVTGGGGQSNGNQQSGQPSKRKPLAPLSAVLNVGKPEITVSTEGKSKNSGAGRPQFAWAVPKVAPPQKPEKPAYVEPSEAELAEKSAAAIENVVRGLPSPLSPAVSIPRLERLPRPRSAAAAPTGGKATDDSAGLPSGGRLTSLSLRPLSSAWRNASDSQADADAQKVETTVGATSSVTGERTSPPSPISGALLPSKPPPLEGPQTQAPPHAEYLSDSQQSGLSGPRNEERLGGSVGPGSVRRGGGGDGRMIPKNRTRPASPRTDADTTNWREARSAEVSEKGDALNDSDGREASAGGRARFGTRDGSEVDVGQHAQESAVHNFESNYRAAERVPRRSAVGGVPPSSRTTSSNRNQNEVVDDNGEHFSQRGGRGGRVGGRYAGRGGGHRQASPPEDPVAQARSRTKQGGSFGALNRPELESSNWRSPPSTSARVPEPKATVSERPAPSPEAEVTQAERRAPATDSWRSIRALPARGQGSHGAGPRTEGDEDGRSDAPGGEVGDGRQVEDLGFSSERGARGMQRRGGVDDAFCWRAPQAPIQGEVHESNREFRTAEREVECEESRGGGMRVAGVEDFKNRQHPPGWSSPAARRDEEQVARAGDIARVPQIFQREPASDARQQQHQHQHTQQFHQQQQFLQQQNHQHTQHTHQQHHRQQKLEVANIDLCPSPHTDPLHSVDLQRPPALYTNRTGAPASRWQQGSPSPEDQDARSMNLPPPPAWAPRTEEQYGQQLPTKELAGGDQRGGQASVSSTGSCGPPPPEGQKMDDQRYDKIADGQQHQQGGQWAATSSALEAEITSQQQPMWRRPPPPPPPPPACCGGFGGDEWTADLRTAIDHPPNVRATHPTGQDTPGRHVAASVVRNQLYSGMREEQELHQGSEGWSATAGEWEGGQRLRGHGRHSIGRRMGQETEDIQAAEMPAGGQMSDRHPVIDHNARGDVWGGGGDRAEGSHQHILEFGQQPATAMATSPRTTQIGGQHWGNVNFGSTAGEGRNWERSLDRNREHTYYHHHNARTRNDTTLSFQHHASAAEHLVAPHEVDHYEASVPHTAKGQGAAPYAGTGGRGGSPEYVPWPSPHQDLHKNPMVCQGVCSRGFRGMPAGESSCQAGQRMGGEGQQLPPHPPHGTAPPQFVHPAATLASSSSSAEDESRAPPRGSAEQCSSSPGMPMDLRHLDDRVSEGVKTSSDMWSPYRQPPPVGFPPPPHQETGTLQRERHFDQRQNFAGSAEVDHTQMPGNSDTSTHIQSANRRAAAAFWNSSAMNADERERHRSYGSSPNGSNGGGGQANIAFAPPGGGPPAGRPSGLEDPLRGFPDSNLQGSVGAALCHMGGSGVMASASQHWAVAHHHAITLPERFPKENASSSRHSSGHEILREDPRRGPDASYTRGGGFVPPPPTEGFGHLQHPPHHAPPQESRRRAARPTSAADERLDAVNHQPLFHFNSNPSFRGNSLPHPPQGPPHAGAHRPSREAPTGRGGAAPVRARASQQWTTPPHG